MSGLETTTPSYAQADADAPLLAVEGIVKDFGRGKNVHRAVNDVSFTLQQGESLGIIGESGSGKTTLARIAIGLEKADAGSVLFQGVRRATYGPLPVRLETARQMQIVFQDPTVALDPRESLVQALERILSLHFRLDKAGRDARVRRLVDSVGLTERQAQAQPRDLSGGQRQRIAIARAISVEPKVLVLDEAVSALDVSVQAQILNLLNDLREQTGMSYLFISHDLSVVRYVTDRSIVMRNGNMVEEGNTERLLTNPAHPYTRLLIASVPDAHWQPEKTRALRAELDAAEAISAA
ncbi:ABC transporter ATP-binding protein [Salinibacterium sp. dk2585]|uniref:ABC transporter ATP-binding protein n=1 Tax=unclassified Salinibacterium TaxID=2632331 RepID=UPI0011C24395|nr:MULTISPECIES: ATP-binding cassette domain-containing protein [unclassified Salinibacterium]QEE62049.1 ABC transporter ATP-binding protein [Salinibacterium sp. dk2585]TXK53401.1 ABC transporter ATP-binding protein [Salinibacterium sp. dk5596]